MLGLVPRSAAVVGIVGALSFGMPVAAQADTSVSVLKFLANVATFGGVAGIGVKAAAPAATTAAGFACAAAMPVCVGVAAATVGAALYMTQDTWVPWFTNGILVPAPPGSIPCNNPASGWCNLMTLSFGTGVPTMVQGENVVIHHSAPTRTTAFKLWGDIECRTAAGAAWSGTFDYVTATMDTNGPEGNFTSGQCPAGHTLTYILVHGGWAATLPNTGQMTNSLSWGSPAGQGQAPAVASLEVQCKNADGSTYAVTSSVPSEQGLVQAPTCTGAPGDTGGAVGKCVTLSAGATAATMVVQSSNCVTVAGTDLQYPNCSVSGCAYMVIVDGVPCTVGRPGCTDWARTYANSPGRVGCRYGEYAVKVSSCFFLERVYESSGDPVDGTLANTDGDVATWTGTEPAPQPQPSTAPIPDGAPGGAPGTLPGGGALPMPSPVGAPSTSGDCWGSATFSWNPVDWVVTPVKCALAWAFVPTAIDTSPVTAQLNRAGIGPSVAALSTAVGSLGGSEGGCTGPSVNFDIGTVHQVVTPFAACTAPMSTVASYAYAFISVVTVIGGASKIIAALGAGFGFGGPPPTWQQGTLF